VPYLTAALSARPGDHTVLATIRNPVFAEMDQALRAIPQRD
jgi:hypothetical protein